MLAKLRKFASGLLALIALRSSGLIFLHHTVQHLYAQPRPVRWLAWGVRSFEQILYGADIHPSAQIHDSVGFAHTTGTVIGSEAVIHADAVLFGGVTLGGLDRRPGNPEIGRGAVLYAGCCVLGGVTVGEGARVGANAVVMDDVPPGRTAVGAPARLTSPQREPA